MEGCYTGTRIKTIYNVKTDCVDNYESKIKYEIKKINCCQYIVYQYNLTSGHFYKLLCFNNEGTLTSTSLGGIDRFEKDGNKFVHYWSIPEKNGKLINACTEIKKTNCSCDCDCRDYCGCY